MCAWVLPGLLLTGCLGRSPEPRFYTLGSEVRAADAPLSSELAILVGPIRFPRYLERPQLVRRLGGGELSLDEFNRWIGSFEDNVSRALAYDVANRVESNRVVAYPSDPPFTLDYRVRIHFDELVVGDDDVLRMRSRWSIQSARGGREKSEEAMLGRTDLDQPVGSGSITAIVEAHDAAIEKLADAIVEAIRGLESAEEVAREGSLR
jgi:uncharacterized lipoprotein YmbA